MNSSYSKNRRVWVITGILFWLAIGLSIPLIVNLSGDDLHLDSGVVAAPRDSYKLTGTLLLDPSSRTILSGGTLALAMPKNKRVTAEVAADQLGRGEAILLLRNGEIGVGLAGVLSPDAADQRAAPLVKALTSGRFKTLVVRDSTVIVSLPKGHQERLSRVDMRLASSSAGRVEAEGTGFWRGQRTKFSLKTSGGKSEGDFSVSLKFEATLIDIAYDGLLSLHGHRKLQGQARLDLKNTDRFAQAMGTSWPISTNVDQVKVAGLMRWQSDVLAFDDAEVRVNENIARGTVSLNTSGQTLISSTLAFDKLDIAAHQAKADTSSRVSGIFRHWWDQFASRLSKQSSKHIDADVRISAKTLVAGKYSFGPAAATISMKNGTLSADVAEIALDTGRAAGQLTIDFNRYIPKLTLRGQLEDIAVGRWAELLTGERHIEGKGRLFAELSSQGTRLQQIMSELSGRIELALPETGTIGLSVAELDAASAKNQGILPSDLLRKAMKGSTQVTDFTAVWRFEDGNGRLEDATAKHPNGLLRARGMYDLSRQSYDIRLLSIAGAGVTAEADNVTEVANKPLKTKPIPKPAPRVGTLLRIRAKGKIVIPRAPTRPEVILYTATGAVKDLEHLLGPFDDKTNKRGL